MSPSTSAISKERTLTVRASKTDQEGTGESLYVCDATRNVLNAVSGRVPASHAVRCSVTSAAAGMSSRIASQPSPHAVSFRNARTLRAWKVSSPGIRFESALPSPSPKPAQPSSICKSLVGGSPHRCRRIMPKPNSPNAVRSQGSKTASDNQDTHRSQVVASGYNTQNVPSTSESTFSAGVTYCLPRVDRNRCQSQHVHRNRFDHPNRRHGFC